MAALKKKLQKFVKKPKLDKDGKVTHWSAGLLADKKDDKKGEK